MEGKTKEELEREGWKIASITTGEHLRRTVEMYQELGFDVYLEEVNPEECGGCVECYKLGDEKIFRIYYKPKGGE